ncbi:MAG: ankyrin repeat domain-containing protein, partial [Desulfuromonadaceae bacterium]
MRCIPHHIPALLTIMICALVAGCASNQELLVSAALRGDTADVQKLLRPGKGDVNTPAPVSDAEFGTYCPGHKMLTPLQAAACSGQLAAVERLLAEKPAIDQETAGANALALASEKGHAAVVRTLLESGANPDTRDARGLTILMAAANAGNLDLVRVALRKHADVALTDRDGATALFFAATPEVARELVLAGSDLKATVKGSSLLHNAAKHHGAAMVEYFLEQGLSADQSNDAEQTPYTLALQRSVGTSAGGAAKQAATAGHEARLKRVGARRSQPAGGADEAAAPAATGDAAAVLELLKKEMQRLVKTEMVEAGRLADAGRTREALAAYTRVINRAAGVDTELERQMRVGIIRYAASWAEPPALPESSREHL